MAKLIRAQFESSLKKRESKLESDMTIYLSNIHWRNELTSKENNHTKIAQKSIDFQTECIDTYLIFQNSQRER